MNISDFCFRALYKSNSTLYRVKGLRFSGDELCSVEIWKPNARPFWAVVEPSMVVLIPYTGKVDSGGARIFSGDILRDESDGHYYVMKLRGEWVLAHFSGEAQSYFPRLSDSSSRLTRVGNVHERCSQSHIHTKDCLKEKEVALQ